MTESSKMARQETRNAKGVNGCGLHRNNSRRNAKAVRLRAPLGGPDWGVRVFLVLHRGAHAQTTEANQSVIISCNCRPQG